MKNDSPVIRSPKQSKFNSKSYNYKITLEHYKRIHILYVR